MEFVPHFVYLDCGGVALIIERREYMKVIYSVLFVDYSAVIADLLLQRLE